MIAHSPELQEILTQVEAELTRMVESGETGTVVVHCGRGDVVVEVTRKHKHEPVRFQGKRLTVIARDKPR